MTTFLHTADVHLSPDHPEREAAFRAVLELARAEGVDALLVAGDLLDRGTDSARLRPDVREAFAGLDVPTVLIPGNHDVGAYEAGQDWGPRTRVLRREPFQATEVAGIRLVGVPFPADEATTFGRIRPALARALREAPGVLLLHGTLIEEGDPRIQREAADDEPGRYLPVHLQALAELAAPYVALGHYHQRAVRDVGGRTVAYSGSPSPVGSHALGPRSATLIRLEPGGGPGDGPALAEVRPVELDVAYRSRWERWLPPFEEESALESLDRELAGSADPRCRLTVRLDGILAGLSEAELRERTRRIREDRAGDYRELAFDLAGVGLEEDLVDLFRDFRDRLEARERGAAGPDREEGPPLDDGLRQRALEVAARALRNAAG